MSRIEDLSYRVSPDALDHSSPRETTPDSNMESHQLSCEAIQGRAAKVLNDALALPFLESLQESGEWINENSYKNTFKFQLNNEDEGEVQAAYNKTKYGEELYIGMVVNGEHHFVDISTKENGILDVKDEQGLSLPDEDSSERSWQFLETVNGLIIGEKMIEPEQEVILPARTLRPQPLHSYAGSDDARSFYGIFEFDK